MVEYGITPLYALGSKELVGDAGIVIKDSKCLYDDKLANDAAVAILSILELYWLRSLSTLFLEKPRFSDVSTIKLCNEALSFSKVGLFILCSRIDKRPMVISLE